MNVVETIDEACMALLRGGLLAYPTEAVYGLGVLVDDETALQALYALKGRDLGKGVIVVASNIEQLLPLMNINTITQEEWARLRSRWPGPCTWVVPAAEGLSAYITGGRSTIAVRVSAHPTIQGLCNTLNKPLVSTSANLQSFPPEKSWQGVCAAFEGTSITVLKGAIGEQASVTTIIDLKTHTTLR